MTISEKTKKNIAKTIPKTYKKTGFLIPELGGMVWLLISVFIIHIYEFSLQKKLKPSLSIPDNSNFTMEIYLIKD